MTVRELHELVGRITREELSSIVTDVVRHELKARTEANGPTRFGSESHDIADRVLEAAATACECEIVDILTGCRERPVATARALVCWELVNQGWSITRTARTLTLNHNTVTHHVKRCRRNFDGDRFRREYKDKFVAFLRQGEEPR